MLETFLAIIFTAALGLSALLVFAEAHHANRIRRRIAADSARAIDRCHRRGCNGDAERS